MDESYYTARLVITEGYEDRLDWFRATYHH